MFCSYDLLRDIYANVIFGIDDYPAPLQQAEWFTKHLYKIYSASRVIIFLKKLGNLSPTRDLTFVKDTCAGFLNIYMSDKLFGKVTNIGVNSEISIGDLAK